MGYSQKIFILVWRCYQLLSGFLAKDHLSRVSHRSRLSTDVKGDNEMIPGAVHRSPGIYLTAKENAQKTSARRPSMKAVRPVVASNGALYFQMKSVSSHSTWEREKRTMMPRTNERSVWNRRSASYSWVSSQMGGGKQLTGWPWPS